MDEPQEIDKGIDLAIGLGIGDRYYLSKIDEKTMENDASTPSLHLSFTSSDQEDDGIKVKEDFDEEEIKTTKNNICRKKLRLTKEQSDLLECSFNQNPTLLPVKKHSLAERLNLTPRQVEVWFQNRRARTKLKQTAMDCQFLKKRCEILSNENMKLKKELQELKSQKLKNSQLCLHFPTCDHKKETTNR